MRAAAIHAAIHSTAGALALTLAAAVPAGALSGTPETPGTPAPQAQAQALGPQASPPDSAPQSLGVLTAAAQAAEAGINWTKCPATEHLPQPVECGTVSVPVDYAAPHGDKIALTVSRAKATGEAGQRLGPLVYNPGGPGGNGMSFPLYGKLVGGVWKRLNARYDFVGFAPRGVGRSGPLSCQDPKRFLTSPNVSPRHPSSAFKQKMNKQAAAYAQGCARTQGSRLPHYTTPNNARDLDVLRAALGQRKLNYLGVSYGTYIGSVYATLFPGHVRRLVLDSVVNPSPDSVWYQANLDQNRAFETRWSDWKQWVAQHGATYGLGSTPRQVQRAFDEVRAAVDRKPAGGKVGSKELVAAYLDTGYADSTWAPAASALSRFRKGDPKPLVKMAAPQPASAKGEENGNAVYNAVECQDAPWPRDWERWERDNTASARIAPFNTWENVWMNLPCAYWKTTPSQPLDVRTQPGQLPPVLLVAATRDAATPYEGAVETHRRLPGSSLVTENGAGNHGVTGGNKCADEHVERYLLEGKTPGDQAECPARPAPRPKAKQPVKMKPVSNARASR
ncbi:alpha/beta hydrolase [Streptomyces sp. NBC_01186]|uniref:alpha/beta hydrolase n=1 Tax=Streptomyces sp. NBC_01186 TaxID=2903765 RepID=UPI002E1300B4|nr:alpha/beta hydrolase [Streptomyces sp. NBC_01186]